jgi:peptide/nickel transport system substrate-binding protein
MKKAVLLVLVPVVICFCTTQTDNGTLPAPARAKETSVSSPVILNVCLKRPYFSSFLPSGFFYNNDSHIYELIYNTLITADYSGRLAPEAAECWEVSNDGKEYTFWLRKNITFHNGKLLTADDVLFSLKQLVSNASQKNTELLCVEGADDFAAKRTTGITGLEKIDDFTFKVKLKRPCKYFLHFLSSKSTSIIPGNFGGLSRAGFREHPIGTGPFKFQHYRDKTLKGFDFHKFTFIRNTGYFNFKSAKSAASTTANGKNKKKRTKMKTTAAAGNVDRLNLYLPRKEPDLDTLLYFDLFVKDLTPGQKDFFTDRNVINSSYDLETILAINPNENQRIRSKKIRQLINYSINREQLVKSLSPGNCIPAHLLMPVNLFGHNPYYRLDYRKARQLDTLKAGSTVTFSLLIHPRQKKLAEYIRGELKKLNINMEIILVDAETYSRKIEQGINHSIIITGSADYPSAYNFLIQLYRPDGLLNILKINSPQILALIGQLPLIDIKEEVETLKHITRLIEEESIYIPLNCYANIIVMKPEIKRVLFKYPSIINFSSIEVDHE